VRASPDAGGRDKQQRRVRHHPRHQRRRDARRDGGDRHVDQPLLQHGQRVGGVAGLQLDVNVGVLFAEAAQDPGEKTLRRRDRREQRDGARQRLGVATQLAPQPLPAVQRLARVLGEASPLRRQPYRPPITFEQGPTHLLLEALDGPRQRRRADVSFPAGPQKV